MIFMPEGREYIGIRKNTFVYDIRIVFRPGGSDPALQMHPKTLYVVENSALFIFARIATLHFT